MAACTYCGAKAGFLKNFHQACLQQHEAGSILLEELVSGAVFAVSNYSDISAKASEIARSSHIKPYEISSIVKRGFDKGAYRLATEGCVDPEILKKIAIFGEAAGLEAQAVSNTKGFLLCMLAMILGAMKNGCPVELNQTHPFSLEPEERPILFVNDVLHVKSTTSTSRQGAYSGISASVGGGIRVNVGGYQSAPASTHQFKRIDEGSVLIATRSLYFRGSQTAFRLKYDKIMSLELFDDALGFFKTGTSSKLELLQFRNAAFPHLGQFAHQCVGFLCSAEGKELYSG